MLFAMARVALLLLPICGLLALGCSSVRGPFPHETAVETGDATAIDGLWRD